MTKKHFIQLANVIKDAKCSEHPFSDCQIALLADFCQSQNGLFKRDRWIDYIKGQVGPSGGKVGK